MRSRIPLKPIPLRILLLLLFALLSLPSVKAQQNLKNLPEYSLPLTDRKLIIAHCMTNIIRYKGHPLEDSANPAYYRPEGNISAPLGGLTQVNVLADELLKEATLDEAVAFEMKAAIKSGIDGFQFYYVLGNSDWDTIIKAYFRVADQLKLNFKFTFCFSHPNGSNENLKIYEFAVRIKDILKTVGKDNPHWLRTPDGRLLVYTWYGDGLADIPADKKGLPDQYYIAKAYKKLADAVNEQFAVVFSINESISQAKLNDYLDYFPGTWIWTLPWNQHYIGQLVAATCKKRGRTFTGSVFNDFYTSKLLKKGTWDMFYDVTDAVDAGIKKVERRYVVTGLSYNFRKLFEFGIGQDVPIMNVITWNDYPEGHHIAPEANHNFGFAVLLNYYKSVFTKAPRSFEKADVAIVFFKKYQHKIKPVPYNIPVVKFQAGAVPEQFEDSIDVVTILKEKAKLKVNGITVDVAAGLQSTKFAPGIGNVQVVVIRDNVETINFTTPEGITAKPYRTDRLTYSWSSEEEKYWQALFPNRVVVTSREY